MTAKLNLPTLMRYLFAFLALGLTGARLAKAQNPKIGLSSYDGNFSGFITGFVNNAGSESYQVFDGVQFSDGAWRPHSEATVADTTAQVDTYLYANQIRQQIGSPGTTYYDSFVGLDCLSLQFASFDTSALGDVQFAVEVYLNGALVGTANTTGPASGSGSSATWSLDSEITVLNTVDGDEIESYFYAYSPSGTAPNIGPNEYFYFGLANCDDPASSQICSTSPIPEPSAALLGAIAGSAFMFRRRRRR